jgi:membrane associated rhomboid family serine protease
MNVSVTLAIIIITCLVSIPAFGSQKIIDDLVFFPPAIAKHNQWYRFFTCGFIHADWLHLFINMYAFYGFGLTIELTLANEFGGIGRLLFVILYITALFFCLVPTYIKHKDDNYYRSLGASGAVSAIVFAYMLLNPTGGVGIIFLPFSLPAFILGPVYLIVSSILARKGGSSINHSAHFWGAIYGIVFIIVIFYFLSDINLPAYFISQVQGYFSSL